MHSSLVMASASSSTCLGIPVGSAAPGGSRRSTPDHRSPHQCLFVASTYLVRLRQCTQGSLVSRVGKDRHSHLREWG